MPRTIDGIFCRIVLESADKSQQGARREFAVKFSSIASKTVAGGWARAAKGIFIAIGTMASIRNL